MASLERKDLEGSGGKKLEAPDAVGEFNQRIKKQKAEEAAEERRNGKPIDVEAEVVSDDPKPNQNNRKKEGNKRKPDFGKVEESSVPETAPKKEKSYFVTYTILVILLGVFAYFLGAIGSFLILTIGILIILGMIWFLMAPNNIIWNFTAEGTCKVIVRGDRFMWAFIQWEGHTLDNHWNVIKEDENHKESWHFGGLRRNGIPLLDTVFEYPLRWKSVRLTAEEKGGQGEMVKFHEEVLDFVPLRSEVYYIKIYGAETSPPERLALDIEFLTTLQVFNAYLVLWVAPYNWVENVMTRLSALYTNWVGTKTLDEILVVKKDEGLLWKEIGGDELINTILIEWGVRVTKHGVQVRKVDMPPDYQKAIAEEKKQKLQAAGRAAETIGTLLASVAYISGKTIAEVQGEIQKDPKRQDQYLEIAKDLITRKIAIEGGSYLDIRTEGAEGLEKSLLNVFAAWQRMPQGKQVKRKEQKEEASK